jgi:hypothetical protein
MSRRIKSYSGAVLILGFNRPEKTLALINSLRKVTPNRIYFAVDGPRIENLADERNVLRVKDCIKYVDWDCEVKTLYQLENIGCRMAVISAIDWFFSQEDFGIILEDDTLPDPSFFDYVEDMRNLYREDERVMHISGGINSLSIIDSEIDHYFSKHINVWGWATWAKHWKRFDLSEILSSNRIELGLFRKHFKNLYQAVWFQRYVWESKSEEASSWAVPWSYCIIKVGGLSISPTSNLVLNTGFDSVGTHGTSKKMLRYADLPISKWRRKSKLPDGSESEFFDGIRFDMIKKTDANLEIWPRVRFMLKLTRFILIPSRIDASISRLKRKIIRNV